MIRITLVIFALGLVSCSAEPPATSSVESEGEIVVTGPGAFGFFPPITQQEKDEDDGGLSEGYSHLAFALEDIEECLSPKEITVQIKSTRSLHIKNESRDYEYDFPRDWAHSIGIVLVDLGREPVVVYAEAGPSSLLELGPQAAWKFFSETNCKRYEE
jgi:hypothetical protein